MSGYNNDTNPSSLGSGTQGNALSLLGGGGGSKGGSGMVGGGMRASDRFTLRQAFKTNNLNKDLSKPVETCGLSSSYYGW